MPAERERGEKRAGARQLLLRVQRAHLRAPGHRRFLLPHLVFSSHPRPPTRVHLTRLTQHARTHACTQHSWRDYVGFALGLLAIVCWVFAQVRGRAARGSGGGRDDRGRRPRYAHVARRL